jgi:hypothetical protein
LYVFESSSRYGLSGNKNGDRLDRLTPVLCFGMLFLLSIGPIMWLLWSIFIIVRGALPTGLTILLGGITCWCILYGIMYWRSNAWRWTAGVSVAFAIAALSYFALVFALSFTSSNVTFFGESVTFLALNYLCLIELITVVESADSLDLLPEQPPSTLPPPPVTANAPTITTTTTTTTTTATSKPMTNNNNSNGPPSTPSIAWAGENKGNNPSPIAATATTATATATGGGGSSAVVVPLSLIASATIVEDPLETAKRLATEQRNRARRRACLIRYIAGLVVLFVYSAIISWATQDIAADRSLGYIISAAIVFLDFLLYLFTGTGRSTSRITKWVYLVYLLLSRDLFGIISCLVVFIVSS